MATSSMYPTSVPTTQVWDVSQLYSVDVTSPEFKELLVRMYQQINLMANVVNYKDTGLYQNAYEILNGQKWFPNPANNSATAASPILRDDNRFVVYYPIALPNAGTVSFNHNIPTINSSFTFTRIYGVANDTTNLQYRPIPNSDTLMTVNATQITITTTANLSTFTVNYFILEYLKF